MENELFEKLDDLNIKDTKLLLDKDINLSLDHLTIKRIEKSVMRKAGYYNSKNMFKQKINDILGGTIMKRKIAIALAVVAVSSLGGGVYAHAKTTPVAYVSMDINPSVELGVNTFNQVISAEAYNEDGEKILEGTNLVNGDIGDAVKTVIANAVSDGYIKDDVATATTTAAAVEITIATDKDGVADKLDESLKETADKALEDNDVEAEVETDKVALARRDEARQLGITPGKLNLIQKLQALDPTIKVEDYKSSSVKDIQKKAKELRKENNEAVTDNKTNTTTNTDSSTNTNTNNDADMTIEQSTNNSSHGKGSIKKEENSNINSKKEDNDNKDDKEKDTAKSVKQNNNSNASSQNNGNNKEKNKNN